MRMFPLAMTAAAIMLLTTAPPNAGASSKKSQSAGWNVLNCNGHTHVLWGPIWLAPTGAMQPVFIQDRDHDNFTPLKLTVNSITITQGEGCSKGTDFTFPATTAEEPVGGVVGTAVQVRASTCHGPRVYDINVTCEHDGSDGHGGVDPALGTIDLMVTVGGTPPADQDPQTPIGQ
jgi:hypothetical protein